MGKTRKQKRHHMEDGRKNRKRHQGSGSQKKQRWDWRDELDKDIDKLN